jgi:thiamine kinase-like enzyme
MKVLELVNEYSPQLLIKFKLGEELGYGADGNIFDLIDSPDRVIKISILYEYLNLYNINYEITSKVLSYLKANKPSAYAHVFEHESLYNGTRTTCFGMEKYTLHYYVMEKLYKITEDEKKVFHSIMSHEDLGIKKQYSTNVVNDMLQGMKKGLDFDLDKILFFYKSIKQSYVIHNDLHVRNIMKDNNNSYKLIDFDRCSLVNQ